MGPAIVLLCVTGTLQPAVCMLGEDVTLYVVEGVEDSVALVDGDEVGIVQDCQLLAEDVMEKVEVVVDEEREQGSSQEVEDKTVGGAGTEETQRCK
ncbi:unnamed protein product [Rangifer tarandus platyrhynchus]|uniref:Uncharacterized protein n=1 Tax=Rangifer tarandus platyrhynchus TaxID=3082113 RepID=A0ABN8XNJ1_RANTA|nr:unnamed protein product [Rangifer tarandus platyrhynchus]CAI9150052.1 unnamed protein product [Rangifer tarandus platyrhynchus]